MGKPTLKTHENNAQSTVNNNPLTSGGTTLNVPTGEGAVFPSSGPFMVTIWDKATYPDPIDDSNMEIVECTSRSTDALTITRGEESTSGVEHAQGSAAEAHITSETVDKIEAAIPKVTYVNLFATQQWDNSDSWNFINSSKIKMDDADFADCDIYLEVVGKTDNASYAAQFDLYDDDSSSEVTNSLISVTSTTDVVQRSSSALTLTSGEKTYAVRYKSQNAVYANIYAARLVFIHK